MSENAGANDLPSGGESSTRDSREVDDASCSSSSSRPCETDWKPCSRAVLSVHEGMIEGISPRDILRQLLPHATIGDNVDESVLWQVIVNLLTDPPVRSKLSHYNTLDDAVDLLRSSAKIIVLTGAGVSVSCGIPDFRSRNGIYSRLRREFPDLPNPETMFDLEYFKRNPKPFYEFAREIYPGQYQPSLCHRFVRSLESHGKLLRNYTQNIDLLEKIAGIQRVVQCHGSFATASCCACKYQVDCEVIRGAVFEKTIPRCPQCPADVESNFMKPDIVFFGEDLPSEFHELFTADKEEVDLLIVIGSSLKVRPVALVPNCVPGTVPQILINREPLQHFNFDIELLGNCDTIVSELCRRLGDDWAELAIGDCSLHEVGFSESTAPSRNSVLSKRPLNSKTSSPKRARVEEQDGNDGGSGEESVKGSGKHDPGVEELRKMYKPRLRNLASELEDNHYFCVPPSRYVFSGAEVFIPWDDDRSTSTSPSSSPLPSPDKDEGLNESVNDESSVSS